MEQLTESKVKTDKYFNTGLYVPAVVNSRLKLPNCTTFAMCAWHWCFKADKSYKLMTGRSAAGFGHAKDWYQDYLFEKGTTPKIAAIAVWGPAPMNGNYGHVAFVKSCSGNKITVYQSSYGSFLFKESTYTVAPGVTTAGLGAPFIGFLYHPFYKDEKSKTPETKKTNVELAKEVLEGKWGNGANRKIRLESAGYNYTEVQTEVNKLVSKDNTKTYDVNKIALEVINGKWGNGATRKKKLTEAGYDYTLVQAEVNKILKK